MPRLIIFLLGLLTLASPAAARQGVPLTRADLNSWLDGYMPFAINRADIAGATVVVVKDGHILLQKGYGYSDVAGKIPVDPEHSLFRPGSIAKLFTWTAVMQLVEQGKLDLDADVNRYLDFKIPARDGQPVTLRNLMTHTPGFEDVLKNPVTSGSRALMPLDAYLKSSVPRRIFPAGKIPAYSNYGASLAGYIVERVSGEPFEAYIERHLFSPLGMVHSSFRQPLPKALRPRMAKGYGLASDQPEPFEIVSGVPAGSLSATGSDMARFMIAHLQKGRYGSARILRPETADLMHGTANIIIPSVNNMRLGFFEISRNGRLIIGHGGDTQWFRSYLYLFPNEGVGLYVSLNSAGKPGTSRAIRSALLAGFTDRYFPASAIEGNIAPAIARQHARMIAGTYQLSRRSEWSPANPATLIGSPEIIINEDDSISLSLFRDLNGALVRWREVAPFVWQEVDGKDRLAAKIENGKLTMFSTDQTPFMVFQPFPWWKSPAWLKPAFIISLAALLLTLILWPANALVRRYYGVEAAPNARSRRSYHAARGASLAIVFTLLIFAIMMNALMTNVGRGTSAFDPWFWMLHILALIVFVAAPAVTFHHAWSTWADRQSWLARLWSIVLFVACLIILWAALVYRLIAFSVRY